MVPQLLLALAAAICTVHGQSNCETPSGAAGQCMSLYDCQPLLAIINKPNRSKQDEEILRKSQCGFQGQTPMVCCPAAVTTDNRCFTPDATEGRCISLYSCPHVAALLQPATAENIAFVQNSRCEGPEQYSICCGPPRSRDPPNTGTCQLTAAPPAPSSGCCGADASTDVKITGGNATKVDQYPWLVIIEYIGNDNRIKLLCGGSLISGRYVLTAGHCVSGRVLDSGTPKNVRLGEYDLSNKYSDQDCVEVESDGIDCTEGVTVIAIEKVIPHPQYNSRSSLRRDDIALLRLAQTAPYTDFIRPICLPTSDVSQSPPPNLSFFAAGWGAVNELIAASDIKLHVDLPFKSHQQCQPAYSVNPRKVELWRGQICAGGEKDKDSCKGDSGGPLMYENGRIYELVGIVSFGPTPCGLKDIPGVYTKVYEYLPWIRSQIKP